MELRYGTNPHQAAEPATPVTPGRWPVRVLNGQPSLINLLDALNGWQLVREASRALGRPAAASFKHVSPAGAAVAGPVDEVTSELYGLPRTSSGSGVGALTSAYLRARDADPKSSYGDLAALSHPVDRELAELLAGVVCDGVVAPGYEPGTVERLSRKKGGRFLVLEADGDFTPPPVESREVFGLRLTEQRDQVPLSAALLDAAAPDPAGLDRAGLNTAGLNTAVPDTAGLAPAVLDTAASGPLPQAAVDDLLLGLAVVRYTQSNSVCYLRDGAALGIGAGQQSRVDCTRLAGAKVDTWWLRRHPAVRALAFRPDVRRQERINWQVRFVEGDLTPDESRRLAAVLTAPAEPLTADQRARWRQRLTGLAFVSDGALPFRDNVDHAHRHGVRHIAEPGGSIRSDEVAAACRELGITLTRTGLRLFHH